MEVTKEVAERMTTQQRLLNPQKLPSRLNAGSMNSVAIPASASLDDTFAMVSAIVVEVSEKEYPSSFKHFNFDNRSSGEDEENCPANRASCGNNEFRCRSDGNCMPMEKYCDGVKHCADGSDEDCIPKINATFILNNDCKNKPGLFFCDDTCFPLMKQCDGARDCISGEDEEKSFCEKHQRIYQVVSIGVNERTLNTTSFLIYWWIAVPQNLTFEYLPSIFIKGAWRNNTEWVNQTEYRFNNLEPFTLYNVTVYVRINGSHHEFVPYLYYEVATAEGGEFQA